MISTGGELTILESVDSTNNYAMAMVRSGLAKHGDGFFAMAQVSGKGQRGKTWVTERGTNIIITLAMQPGGLQMHQQFQLSAAVALGVYDFFSHYAGEETYIKWPNDIYWRDRKAGGILIENVIVSRQASDEGEKSKVPAQDISIENNFGPGMEGFTLQASRLTPSPWQWAIIGMGININQTSFPEHIRNAVSLKQITGKEWEVVALAKELCVYVQNRYEQLLTGKDLLMDYNSHLFKKGQTVKFKKDSRVFDAVVKEVNNAGELVLITAMEEHFNFGEIEWIF